MSSTHLRVLARPELFHPVPIAELANAAAGSKGDSSGAVSTTICDQRRSTDSLHAPGDRAMRACAMQLLQCTLHSVMHHFRPVSLSDCCTEACAACWAQGGSGGGAAADVVAERDSLLKELHHAKEQLKKLQVHVGAAQQLEAATAELVKVQQRAEVREQACAPIPVSGSWRRCRGWQLDRQIDPDACRQCPA